MFLLKEVYRLGLKQLAGDFFHNVFRPAHKPGSFFYGP